jgi:hypothetical protein
VPLSLFRLNSNLGLPSVFQTSLLSDTMTDRKDEEVVEVKLQDNELKEIADKMIAGASVLQSYVFNRMCLGLDVRDRTYHLKSYPRCFIGNEAVEWSASLCVLRAKCKLLFDRMIRENVAADEEQALKIGNVLLRQNVFKHVHVFAVTTSMLALCNV